MEARSLAPRRLGNALGRYIKLAVLWLSKSISSTELLEVKTNGVQVRSI